MIKVVLICNGGASTGILAKNIKSAAISKNLDLEINAFSDSKISDVIDKVDIVLLGPQIGFKLKRIQEKFPSRARVISVINPIDYGMMNGAKVLEQIEVLYTQQKKENK